MSNQVFAQESDLASLKDKVVVLTGGANGIGKASVQTLAHAGAHVVFGDHDQAAGTAFAQQLSTLPHPPTFVHVDVSKYEDNVKLFKTALAKHGRVDHAVACAGILERGKWFDPALTVDTVEQPDTDTVVEINLLGVLYFTRIALVYLRHARGRGEDRSIVLVASAAGFRDSPGLYLYQCSKHGVMGLLRSTRKIFYERDNVRINAVCPGITETAMTTGIIGIFRERKQAINSAADVAKYVNCLLTAGKMTGKAVYVEGGRGWEFMDGLDASMGTWLGKMQRGE